MSDFPCYIDTVFDPNDIVELRLLGKGLPPVKRWHTAHELPGQQTDLLRLNARGYNVYVGPNPRKVAGKSGDENVLLARTLFCDFDKIPEMDGCAPWNEVSERIHEAGLAGPDLVLHSGHGLHTYWRLDEPLKDLGRWSEIQKNLIKALGSDPCIHNSERIMRMPGFQNVKDPNIPVDCRIIF